MSSSAPKTTAPAALVALADRIDSRLGPIPGPLADATACALRAAALDIRRLQGLLFRLYNVVGAAKFERGSGPPVLADGAYDKIMAETNAELQEYTP